MNRKGKAVVFILSLICVFLTGFICGYFLHLYLRTQRISSYYEPAELDNVEDYYDYDAAPIRKDILFYYPDGDAIWSNKLEEIPGGMGVIKGKVYIDNEPAEGLEFALILAPGRKTQTVVIDKDGKFTISIKKGSYYFNGIAVYSYPAEIRNRILTNKVAKYEMDDIGYPMRDANKFIDQFEELSKKYGPEKASQMIAEKVEDISGVHNKCPLLVEDKVVDLPTFRYRKPLKIISPSYNTFIAIEKLKFVWEAIPDAKSYKIVIDHVEKKGLTTSFHPIITCKGIKNNYISYKDVIRMNDYTYPYESQSLQPGKTYGMRVVAYNEEDNVVTASSEGITGLIIFHTE